VKPASRVSTEFGNDQLPCVANHLCEKIRHNVAFRKEVTERIGLGFELLSKNAAVGPMDRKSNPSQFWKWLQAFDSREISGWVKRI
jgi:hypothetical protein